MLRLNVTWRTYSPGMMLNKAIYLFVVVDVYDVKVNTANIQRDTQYIYLQWCNETTQSIETFSSINVTIFFNLMKRILDNKPCEFCLHSTKRRSLSETYDLERF